MYKDAPLPVAAAKPLLTNPAVSQTRSAPEVQTLFFFLQKILKVSIQSMR